MMAECGLEVGTMKWKGTEVQESLGIGLAVVQGWWSQVWMGNW